MQTCLLLRVWLDTSLGRQGAPPLSELFYQQSRCFETRDSCIANLTRNSKDSIGWCCVLWNRPFIYVQRSKRRIAYRRQGWRMPRPFTPRTWCQIRISESAFYECMKLKALGSIAFQLGPHCIRTIQISALPTRLWSPGLLLPRQQNMPRSKPVSKAFMPFCFMYG